MDTKVQFQRKATVLAADGRQVGSIERVVVNPDTNVLTDIVISTGTLLSKEEKVIPIGLVAETTKDQIILDEEAEDLESFPAFEERHIVDENDNSSETPPYEEVQPLVVGFPVMGPPTVPPVVTNSEERITTRIEQNIPEGTVAVKEGAKVITAEGKRVGTVERVLADSSEDQVTHLLISSGLFMKDMKLIPVRWVMKMSEDQVNLSVKKDLVEKLVSIS